MAGRLEGKVAFITGAARGQGKEHCVRLAEEGADIIAVDLLEDLDTVEYPQGSEADLADTVARTEATGRKIVARKADVRQRDQLAEAVAVGLETFGRLDIVCANAGVLPIKQPHGPEQFVDAMDIDFGGVLNTVAVTLPHLNDGASIVFTGSVAGLLPGSVNNPVLGPGGAGYGLAKQFIARYTEILAVQLASKFIRVNAIHPTNCNTDLLHNGELNKLFRPDLEAPTPEEVAPAHAMFNAMPVPFVEPSDISNALVFLASDESRYVTGMNLRVDAGALLKHP